MRDRVNILLGTLLVPYGVIKDDSVNGAHDGSLAEERGSESIPSNINLRATLTMKGKS